MEIGIRELKLKNTFWFDLWVDHFFSQVTHQRLELLKHPLGMIFLVSAEDNVQEVINTMLNSNKELTEELTLLNIPKIIMMLAANTMELLPKAGTKYESLLKQLKDFHLYLAPLNSLKGTSTSDTEDIWSIYINSKVNIIRGKCVSTSERVKLQDMVREIVSEVIITNVKESIKGVKESLKHTGFFRKNPFTTNPKLQFDLHIAANSAFMLQDYQEAIYLYGILQERVKKVT